MEKETKNMQSAKNNAATEINWEALLVEAVSKPGRVLEAYHLFHCFSIGNALWALVQCDVRKIQPGPLNTFSGWKKLNRHVKKGERAIRLVMPINCKRKEENKDGEEEESNYTRFVIRPNWFVLSQTEGEEVAAEVEIPEWNAAYALMELNISRVPYESMNGNAQGYAEPGRKIAISPIAVLPYKTTFHEMAHVVLEHTEEGGLSDDEQTPRSLMEVEAESVAMLCCESLGLPGAEFSRAYIQNWLDGSAIPEKSAQKIFSAAHKILKAGQENEKSGNKHAA
jgi:antirestriction protein ArdC